MLYGSGHVRETSPGKNALFLSMCLPHLLTMVPCSYWTLTCLAVLSPWFSLMRFLFVRPEICLHLPSDSTSRWTPLVFGYDLPATGRSRDFHPLECAHAGRTSKKPPLLVCERRLFAITPVKYFSTKSTTSRAVSSCVFVSSAEIT